MSVGTATAERTALAALSAVVEPGRRTALQRVAAVGAERTWQEILRGKAAFDRSGRLGRLAHGVDGAQILATAEELGMRFVCPGDQEWPAAFGDLWATLDGDQAVPPPLGLYVRGEAVLSQLIGKSVAVVGSRAASRYGERVSADLAADLALAGWTVVSGAAYGIDAAAHRGSLAVGGATIAVLACGADVAYPTPHRSLLRRIGEDGLIVSELPPGSHPTRSRFIDRNRILAALALGTVVVEAARRSGALSTARWTAWLSRPLMAVPGPITSSLSEGCHELVRTGNTLVTSSAEVIDVVGSLGADALSLPSTPANTHDALAPAAREVREALEVRHPKTVADLVRATGIDEASIVRTLAELAAAGLAQEDLTGWHISRGGA